MMHRPIDLDTASSLALLQEEALQDISSTKETRRQEYYGLNKKYSMDGAKLAASSSAARNVAGDDKKSTEQKSKSP
jgi:hypothetical protein